MNKFKVGDRVRVYGVCSHLDGEPAGSPAWETEGTLTTVFDQCVRLRSDLNSFETDAHYKQCRLLKKKVRRQVWVAVPIVESESALTFFIRPETKTANNILHVRRWDASNANWWPCKEVVEFNEVKAKKL